MFDHNTESIEFAEGQSARFLNSIERMHFINERQVICITKLQNSLLRTVIVY